MSDTLPPGLMRTADGRVVQRLWTRPATIEDAVASGDLSAAGAREIAEIASSTGEEWDEVAGRLGLWQC